MRRHLLAIATLTILSGPVVTSFGEQKKDPKAQKAAETAAKETPVRKATAGNKKAGKKETSSNPNRNTSTKRVQAPSGISRDPVEDETARPRETSRPPAPSSENNGDRTSRETGAGSTAPGEPAWSGLSLDSLAIPLALALFVIGFILHGITLRRQWLIEKAVEMLDQGNRKIHSRIDTVGADLSQIRRAAGSQAKEEEFRTSLEQAAIRIETIEQCLSLVRDRQQTSINAIALIADEAIAVAVRRAASEAVEGFTESDRLHVTAVLERHFDTLNSTSELIEPLADEVRALNERVSRNPYLPPEIPNIVRNLEEQINRFAEWRDEAAACLEQLRRGSVKERQGKLLDEDARLKNDLTSGAISILDYVTKRRRLVEELFPEEPTPSADRITPSELDQRFSGITAGVPEYLMDWYDSFFQLSQKVTAFGSSADGDVGTAVLLIRKRAREALARFDIQPEEIQPGQTSYDNRLHDCELVAQSSQFPVNTVVAVHQCGFRRGSTGEPLRRPKVVVAGVGAY